MACKECSKGFSCGCQKAKAKDGSIVHKTCLTTYNNKIGASNSDPLTKKLNNARNNIVNGR
jgi:hypothetical protein